MSILNSRTALILMALSFISTPVLSAKKPLKIVSLSYNGKCVGADTIVTVNLNKKITRGFSIIAISRKNLHIHPKIMKWPFRSNSIKVLMPPRKVMKRNHRYSISIERRLPHKILSNKKSFRICRK